MSLLITSPHALCDEKSREVHACDLIAGEMARKLHAKIPESIYIEGDIFRYDCDLNRDECKGTDFRQIISRELHTTSVSDLFDVHSFPGTLDTNESMEKIREKAKNEGVGSFSKPDLIVLININLETNAENGPLTAVLREMGRKEGLEIVSMRGSSVNSIVREGLGLGVRSFLFEFNEFGKNNNQVIDLIAKWYNTVLKGRKYEISYVASPVTGIVEGITSDNISFSIQSLRSSLPQILKFDKYWFPLVFPEQVVMKGETIIAVVLTQT